MSGRMGTPLASALHALLHEHVRRDGEPAVRARLGVCAHTMARALAGLGVSRGTALAIRDVLEGDRAA